MGLSRRAGWASALGRDKVGAVAWVVAGRRLRRSSPSGFAVLGRDLFWQRAFCWMHFSFEVPSADSFAGVGAEFLRLSFNGQLRTGTDQGNSTV